MSKNIQIALVSKETLPVFYIINEFRPDEVYLVGTEETTGEMGQIERSAATMGIACHKLVTRADDMAYTMQQCENVHGQHGTDASYRYNLTCGTKLMAFGALLCAQKHHAQVVYSDIATYTDFATMRRQPLQHKLSTETIIALQGQKIKSREVYRYDAQRTECALQVRDFVRRYVKAYSVLINRYNAYKQLPNPFSSGDLYYSRSGGRLSVEYDDVEVFGSDYRDAFKLLFEGRWWETLVADAVSRWADGRYEVWTSVRFEPKDGASRSDKNEVDVLVNVGNVLLFVECKSGAFTQDNIYKLSSVARTYGSYKSKSVIVSFRDNVIRPDLEEKAREQHVRLLVPDGRLRNLGAELDKIVKSINA